MLSSIWKDFVQAQEKKENDKERKSIMLSMIRQIKPLEMTESTLTLGCDGAGTKMFLDKKKGDFEDRLYEFFQRKIAVTFDIIVHEKKKKKETPLFNFEPTKEDVFAKAGLHSKYQFDNFAVSSSNQVAFAAAQAVAQNPGHAYNPLFIYGSVGVGKTHLAQAIARTILERNSDKKAFFCPGDQFTNELIESIREKNTQKFRRKYRYLNIIIIDDIQFIAGKATVQEEFFHTFNSIVSAGGQVVLTSDRPPHEIKNLEDRLRSRFSGGLIVDVQPPDFELRTAVLLIKAQEKNIDIDIDAAKAIADIVEDTRALEGTLLSIYAKTIGKQEHIDLAAIDDFFQEKTTKSNKKITPQDVIKSVCSFYNVKQSHIKSPLRTNEVALARQIIMYLLRYEFKLILDDIAYILKKKDHTTIIHGSEKVQRMVMKDSELKKEIDSIISSLRSST